VPTAGGPEYAEKKRRRLIAAFHRFHDARLQTDREVASLLEQWEIDIVADLGGHQPGAAPGDGASSSAVAIEIYGLSRHLGFGLIDALIADRTVPPPDQDLFFSEKIVAMPGDNDRYWRKADIAGTYVK